MHAETLRRVHAGFDTEPFRAGLYNPRRPGTPEEFTLNMEVEVGSMKLELLFSQPLLPAAITGATTALAVFCF